MKPLILLLAALPTFAAITASPTALTFGMRQGRAYPYAGTRDPAVTAFPVNSPVLTLSGTGSWSQSRGGALATACGGSACFTAFPTSGTDAGSTTVRFTGLGAENLAVGTYTGTLTIDATVVNITLLVFPYNAYDPFVYDASYPVGCVARTNWPSLPDCTIPDEQPPSSAFALPAQGSTYVDPQFGATVRRVAPRGNTIMYGSATAFSATGKYIITSDSIGNVDIYTVATGVETYSNLPSININYTAWSPTDDERLYHISGPSIKYRTLNTASETTLLTMGYNINTGNSSDITDDGWWSFKEDMTDSGQMCAVNLNTAQTYCASMAPYSFTDLNYLLMGQVDSETGKRYAIAIGSPASQVFSVGPSGLVYEFPIPPGGGDFTSSPHADIGQDIYGRQIIAWNWNETNGGQTFYAAMRINKGATMTRPVEEGGGLQILWMDSPVNSQTDGHFGCNWKGLCSFSPYGNSAGITAKMIQSITAANPCQMNSTSHGYSSSNSVLIGGALGTGVSAINAIHTVTVLNANAFTIPIDCSTGYTYTANSANSAINAQTATTPAPFRQEVILTSPGQYVRRIAAHRSKTYANGEAFPNGLTNYGGSPRASISRDGSMIAFASNMGVPEPPGSWVAYTGITTSQVLRSSVTPADTKAVLNYTLPVVGQGDATIVISALPGLGSPVVNATDGLTAQGRQYVATGLTAGTQYYYRVTTQGYAFTGQFRTLPTLSGTGRVTLAKGGGGTINYGATSGLGSSCSSPCDLAVSRGLLYTDVSGAVVVR